LLEGDPFDFVVSIVTEPSDTVESGRVTRTSPNIGSQTTKSSPITLYVSSGQATDNLIVVTGLRESEARNALLGYRVVVEYIDVPAGSANDGLVIAQDPSAGVPVAPGARVLLKVGKAITPATTTTTPTTTTTTTTIP
ncbi:MAG: PASTA domain-containing protein, partial [Actinomycetota bacterium]